LDHIELKTDDFAKNSRENSFKYNKKVNQKKTHIDLSQTTIPEKGFKRKRNVLDLLRYQEPGKSFNTTACSSYYFTGRQFATCVVMLLK